MQIRLNKLLSEAGICSRRAAEQEILAGNVCVNNIVVSELGTKADPEHDIVKYKGKTVTIDSELVYYALYKPRGVVSTAKDEMGRKTVLDLVPSFPRVYPVGRLDFDSEGLIILMNDGELTQKVTHPSFEHEKEYIVDVKKLPNFRKSLQEIKDSFIVGIEIDGQLMKADKIVLKELNPCLLQLTIVLHTGYNRQIRRMCESLGLKVTRLTRVRIGKLSLSALKIKAGEYRIIRESDIL